MAADSGAIVNVTEFMFGMLFIIVVIVIIFVP